MLGGQSQITDTCIHFCPLRLLYPRPDYADQHFHSAILIQNICHLESPPKHNVCYLGLTPKRKSIPRRSGLVQLNGADEVSAIAATSQHPLLLPFFIPCVHFTSQAYQYIS